MYIAHVSQEKLRSIFCRFQAKNILPWVGVDGGCSGGILRGRGVHHTGGGRELRAKGQCMKAKSTAVLNVSEVLK